MYLTGTSLDNEIRILIFSVFVDTTDCGFKLSKTRQASILLMVCRCFYNVMESAKIDEQGKAITVKADGE